MSFFRAKITTPPDDLFCQVGSLGIKKLFKCLDMSADDNYQ